MRVKHFYQKIPGWFSFANIYEQAVREAQDGAYFVEVGSWKGRSAAFMAVEIGNSDKDIDFVCVDTWLGSPYDKHQNDPDVKAGKLYQVFLRNIKPVNHHVSPIRGNSVEVASFYADNSLDFVFIDGNHEYDAVKADIAAWWPKIKYRGVLAGDDFKQSGVKKAVSEAFQGVESVNGGRHWRIRKVA